MHASVFYVQGQEYESAGLFIQELYILFIFLPLKETEKVVLLVLTVVQFHFYVTWFISSAGIAWSV